MDEQNKKNGMLIVYGNQAESLVQLLVRWLKENPLQQPLASEVILTQSNGVKQWLQQNISDGEHGLSVAAALDIKLPAAYLWQMYRTVLGKELVSRECLLDLEPMTVRLWRLLTEIVPTQADNEILQPLLQYWQTASNALQQYQLCQQIANVFDQYQVYRADWLENWQQGNYTISQQQQLLPLEPQQQWQAWLWNRLLQDAQQSSGSAINKLSIARSQLHQNFINKLQQGSIAQPDAIPQRIIVFGISAMSAQNLQALHGLAKYCQVLFLVQNPCQYYWADIFADRDLIKQKFANNKQRFSSRKNLDNFNYGHPLLAAWGKQGRDFIALLTEYDRYQSYKELIPKEAQLYQSSLTEENSLLQQIQDDILHLRCFNEIQQRHSIVDPKIDQSIRFYSCYSVKREVEVLHNQLLQAFVQQPNLKAQDILIMVPDIEVYAPYIRAVFDNYAFKGDKRYISYSLNDQSNRQNAPIAVALEQLLNLPNSRCTVSELFALLDLPAIQQKFAIAEHDLILLKNCIIQANVRWGLHQQQKQQLDLPPQQQNTWLFGLRRILLGLVVDESVTWQGIAALPAAISLDSQALAGLINFLEQLNLYWANCCDAHSSSEWGQILRNLLTDFFYTEDEEELGLLISLDKGIDQWLHLCQISDLTSSEQLVPFEIVKDYWLSTITSAQHGAFLTGGVTFASLLPMRAIPFKMICLLGMNDGAYPRSKQQLSFDLMQNNYRLGDRSRRDDDLYLMLETLLSARQQLYISWLGQSIKDNTSLPPSVLVAQLREHIAQGWQLASNATATSLIDALTTKHPMQAFSSQYYQAGMQDSLPNFANEWESLYKQNASVGDVQKNDSNTPASLELTDWHDGSQLTVDFTKDLIPFSKKPIKYFFNKRLRVYFKSLDEEDFDLEPLVFDNLQKWQVLDSLLQQQLELLQKNPSEKITEQQLQSQLEQGWQQLQLTGSLPTGVISEIKQQEFIAVVKPQLLCYLGLVTEYYQLENNELIQTVQVIQQIELSFNNGSSRQQSLILQANLPSLRINQSQQKLHLSLSTSNLLDKAKNYRLDKLLKFWLEHLVMQLASLFPVTSKIIHQTGCITINPVPCEQASTYLKQWLCAWYQGHNYPLPLVGASYAYVQSLIKQSTKTAVNQEVRQNALDDAKKKYIEKDFMSGMSELDDDLCLQASYPDFERLISAGFSNENHDFISLAEQLIMPINDYLQQDSFV